MGKNLIQLIKFRVIPEFSWFSRKSLALVVATTIGINIIGIIISISLGHTYDEFATQKNSIQAHQSLIIVLLLLATEFCLRVLREALGSFINALTNHKLNKQAFEHLIYTQLNSIKRSNLTSRLKELIEFNSQSMTSGKILMSMLDMPFIPVYLYCIFSLIGPLVIIPMASQLIISYVAANYLNKKINHIQKYNTNEKKKISLIGELILGISAVKTLSAETEFFNKFEKIQTDDNINNHQLMLYSLSAKALRNAFLYLNIILLAIIGAQQIKTGNITGGDLLAAILIAGRIARPINWYENIIAKVKAKKILENTYNYILTLPQEYPQSSSLPVSLKGNIHLKNVSLQHPAGTDLLLKNLNIHIEPNTITHINYESGTGASTLLKSIAGMHTPFKGEVLLDGNDIYQQPHIYRRKIGLVLQHGNLFNGSILENITLFRAELNEQAIDILDNLGIKSIVESLSNSYATVLGSGTENLISTALKQGFLLARILIDNPKIILFDNASFAMSDEKNVLIAKFLTKLKTESTIIIASNKVQLANVASKQYTLKNSSLVMEKHYDNK